MSRINPFSLESEIALITGGGSGLGFGIAKCFVQAGARVILVGRSHDKLKSACAQLGESAMWIAHDITQLKQTAVLVEKASNFWNKPPSIFISNAGNHLKKRVDETSPEEFEAVMFTHVHASHSIIAALLPEMLAHEHGSILFMASMASFLGVPNVFAYSAAKAALIGMTRALASEVSSHGIRVNAIAPGWIESPMLQRALSGDSQRREKILSRTPMRRFGQPEDIGWAAVYLCSPAAKFVTGTVLPVDGGALNGF